MSLRPPSFAAPPLKIALVGPGRSGKDSVGAWLAAHTTLRVGPTTSEVIVPVLARRLGLSDAEMYARRHEFRPLMRATGDEMRASDPAALARAVLARGDIANGIRARVEIEAVIRERLTDEIWWVHRDVPADDTLEFGPEVATLTVDNSGTLAELHRTLEGLARERGILWRCQPPK